MRSEIETDVLNAESLILQVRCWEVEQTGKTIPKSIQNIGAPVLDVAWYDVSSYRLIFSRFKYDNHLAELEFLSIGWY